MDYILKIVWETDKAGIRTLINIYENTSNNNKDSCSDPQKQLLWINFKKFSDNMVLMKYEIQLVKKSTINFVTYKYHGNRQLKPAEILMHLFN